MTTSKKSSKKPSKEYKLSEYGEELVAESERWRKFARKVSDIGWWAALINLALLLPKFVWCAFTGSLYVPIISEISLWLSLALFVYLVVVELPIFCFEPRHYYPRIVVEFYEKSCYQLADGVDSRDFAWGRVMHVHADYSVWFAKTYNRVSRRYEHDFLRGGTYKVLKNLGLTSYLIGAVLHEYKPIDEKKKTETPKKSNKKGEK